MLSYVVTSLKQDTRVAAAAATTGAAAGTAAADVASHTHTDQLLLENTLWPEQEIVCCGQKLAIRFWRQPQSGIAKGHIKNKVCITI